MEKDHRIHLLIRLCNLLLILLVIFLFMKLSPLWLPILQLFIRIAIPIIIAILITYLLHPIVESFHNMGLARPYAVLLIYLLFFGAITLIIVIGSPYVVTQVKAMIEQLPIWVNEINAWTSWFNETITQLPIGLQMRLEQWLQAVEHFAEDGAEKVGQLMLRLLQSLIYFIIVPFLVFYFLKDYKLMEKVAWYLTPRNWRKKGHALLKDIDVSLGNFIRGQILVSLSAGILSMIGLWLIGVPYSIILGIFIAFTDIIPYFGPLIGMIPALFVAAFQSWKTLILTVIVLLIIQQIEGNILSPIIVGKSLQLHPALIMLALIVGIEIGGIAGLILAVPTLAISKVIILHIRKNLQEQA